MYSRSRHASNDELIDHLKNENILQNPRVESVMRKVDRKNYCPSDPYTDSPNSIGYSVTISAPHMHCKALELLEDKLKPGNTCLDVGSGSGYLTACMALMCGPTVLTIGLEHVKELTETATKNIMKDQPGMLESGYCKLIVGDGRKVLQLDKPIQFDAIHVGAAAPELPQALVDQLKPNGRIIIPIGKEGHNQVLEQVDKLPNGQIERKSVMGVIYVPLIDSESQYNKTKHR